MTTGTSPRKSVSHLRISPANVPFSCGRQGTRIFSPRSEINSILLLEPQRRLQDKHPGIINGAGAAGVHGVLEAGLEGPPGGELELVVQLYDAFIVGHDERSRRHVIHV